MVSLKLIIESFLGFLHFVEFEPFSRTHGSLKGGKKEKNNLRFACFILTFAVLASGKI